MRSRLQRINRRSSNKAIILSFLIVTSLPLIFTKIANNKHLNSGEVKGSYSVGVSPTPSLPQSVDKTPQLIIAVNAIESEVDELKEIDNYVGEAVDEFFTLPGQRSEVRMIMHCLLNRESKHNYSKGKGDGGKAEGILQYHEGTWIGYRKIMIEKGLATEIGSQYDNKEAIRTTVWAISDKRATAWGPILRWKNGRYTEASCPLPSFY